MTIICRGHLFHLPTDMAKMAIGSGHIISPPSGQRPISIQNKGISKVHEFFQKKLQEAH